jgi:subtilisin family serine protease
MSPLDLVRLTALMDRTPGRTEVRVGLIDGPVALSHPDLAGAVIKEVGSAAACARASSFACIHGTFVAGILCARRGSAAPGICPACTLILRPIFPEARPEDAQMPGASASELAQAIIEVIDHGVRVINLSVGLTRSSSRDLELLDDALHYAACQGVHVVAAAGNQGTIGSSAITRHPWVIPVVACDLRGRPTRQSNLGTSIGKNGVRAPGDRITSLATSGKTEASGGTSAATPFVSGTLALLWSEFPGAKPAAITLAVSRFSGKRAVVPPLLNAWAAYQFLAAFP